MANKRYADIAAARHMSDLPPGPEADDSLGKDPEASQRPLTAPGIPQPAADRSYRKKRAVALTLSIVICISVPALITLLVLFG